MAGAAAATVSEKPSPTGRPIYCLKHKCYGNHKSAACPLPEFMSCFKCWKYGHPQKACKHPEPLPDKEPVCNMCGQGPHWGFVCPAVKAYEETEGSSCLNCGDPGHKFLYGTPQECKEGNRPKFVKKKTGLEKLLDCVTAEPGLLSKILADDDMKPAFLELQAQTLPPAKRSR